MSLRIHSFSTSVEILAVGWATQHSGKTVRFAIGFNGSRIAPGASGIPAHAVRFDRLRSGHYTHRFLFRGLNDEANVSAEQPPPEADARLPRPDADEGRPGGSLAPSPQGAQAPLRLGAASQSGEPGRRNGPSGRAAKGKANREASRFSPGIRNGPEVLFPILGRLLRLE